MLTTWRYVFRDSWMEKIDPRARWIFSFLMLFSISSFWDVRILLVFFVISFGWYALARVPFRETRRAWMLVTILLTFMVVINTIITGGGASGIIPKTMAHPVWTLEGRIPLLNLPVNFVLTAERLFFGLVQFVRILAISALFLIIPYSMDPRVYGYTFRRLGVPDRFAFTMDLAFRYVPTLARDFSVTLDAQRARGYEIERVEGGLLTQIRKIAPLIVPVTMNSILTGEDVTNAMDLRCFGIHPRTWIQKLEFHRWDYAIIAFAFLVFLVSLVASAFFHVGGFWMPGM
jgi:energy-coupling factor transport system permease protein